MTTVTSINWKKAFIASFAVLMAVLFFYAYQIVCLTKGYFLANSYEKEISALIDDNKNLQLNFAESSFLEEVMQKASALNLEKTKSAIKYIQVIDGPVAVNKIK